MPLKFPNARLHIHNLLRDENVSGAEAIALIAIEYGLVDSDFVHRIEEMKIKNTNDNCSCLQTAKKILDKYFEQRKAQFLADVNVSQVWSSLQMEIQAYLRSQHQSSVAGNGNGNGKVTVADTNVHGNGHGNGNGHSNGLLISSEMQKSLADESFNIEPGHDCTKFAPVVFDLLLQQIRRYP
ncbi:MAG: hypothetical protein K2X77_08260 [Candidatus Obscuribacterales bacterium]|nr:hypothetical protein [Candidatus Obscuribacterales bacterium]